MVLLQQAVAYLVQLIYKALEQLRRLGAAPAPRFPGAVRQQSHERECSFLKAFAPYGYGYSDLHTNSSSSSSSSSSTSAEGNILRCRADQFPQLSGITYLDHAATTLASKQQLQDAHAEQLQHLLANPHSQLPAGLDHSAVVIEELRLLTLSMVNASPHEYEVVFTAGATAALKLVGEAVPWTACSSTCAYLSINHNSALGIRQQAAAAGAHVCAVQVEQLQQQENPEPQPPLPAVHSQQQQQSRAPYSVFIAPAECNMSGTRYDCGDLFLRWQQHCKQQQQQQQPNQLDRQDNPGEQHRAAQQQQQQQQQHWLLLVDAAKACTSKPPDLSSCHIDMLVLSYYKVFGHPTGLGALVLRRSLLPVLQKHKAYFGGGTVEVVLPDSPYVVRRPGAAGLEDGTLPFTAIAAARHGFKQLQRLGGFDSISRHTACLTWYLMLQLLQLKHRSGQAAAVLYCAPAVQQLLLQHIATVGCAQQGIISCNGVAASSDDATSASNHNSKATSISNSSSSSSSSKAEVCVVDGVCPPQPVGVMAQFMALQGPVVAFNLLRPDGSWVGHKEVGKLAAIHNICLRTGCFCNPGACAHYLGLTSQDLMAHHAAGHVCWDDQDVIDGRPTGAVRASFGYMSSYADVAVLLDFLQKFFVNNAGGLVSTAAAGSAAAATLAAAAGASAADSSTTDAQVRVTASAVVKAGAAAAAGVAGAAGGSTVQQHAHLGAGEAEVPTGIKSSSSSSKHMIIPGAANAEAAEGACGPKALGHLTGLYLYPVKSCAPQQVSAWPLGPNGLLYDREWAVCGPDGQVLTQKRAPRLTQVRAEVDLQQQVLRLTAAAGTQQQLLVPLQQPSSQLPPPKLPADGHSSRPQQQHLLQEQQQQQEVRVCGDKVCAQVLVGQVVGSTTQAVAQALLEAPTVNSSTEPDGAHSSSSSSSNSNTAHAAATNGHDAAAAAAGSEAAVQQWFSAAVGLPCRLVRQVPSSRTVRLQGAASLSPTAVGGGQQAVSSSSSQTLGFANEGQYLLVNQASVDYVSHRLGSSSSSTTRAAGAAAGCTVRAPASSGGGRTLPPLQGQPLHEQQQQQQPASVDVLRFRPNLVVSGFSPWAEDTWQSIVVSPPAGTLFDGAAAADVVPEVVQEAGAARDISTAVAPFLEQQQQQQQQESDVCLPVRLHVVGACGRCDMVSIDQQTGQRQSSQLLSLLSRERRAGGKLQFGVLLAHEEAQHDPAGAAGWLRVGDVVEPVLSGDAVVGC